VLTRKKETEPARGGQKKKKKNRVEGNPLLNREGKEKKFHKKEKEFSAQGKR